MYLAKMNSWVHSREYPISKTFQTKQKTLSYIKQALSIYPYVAITLYKYTKEGKETKVKTYTIKDFS